MLCSVRKQYIQYCTAVVLLHLSLSAPPFLFNISDLFVPRTQHCLYLIIMLSIAIKRLEENGSVATTRPV